MEIYGDEAAGKSALALLYANDFALKYGPGTSYIEDAERVYSERDFSSCPHIGGMASVVHPVSLEKTGALVSSRLKAGNLGLVDIDSCAAMLPESDIKGYLGDGRFDRQGEKIVRTVKHWKTIQGDARLILVNQRRNKKTRHKATGVCEDNTSGGAALYRISDIRLDVRVDALIKDQGSRDIVGQIVN